MSTRAAGGGNRKGGGGVSAAAAGRKTATTSTVTTTTTTTTTTPTSAPPAAISSAPLTVSANSSSSALCAPSLASSSSSEPAAAAAAVPVTTAPSAASPSSQPIPPSPSLASSSDSANTALSVPSKSPTASPSSPPSSSSCSNAVTAASTNERPQDTTGSNGTPTGNIKAPRWEHANHPNQQAMGSSRNHHPIHTQSQKRHASTSNASSSIAVSPQGTGSLSQPTPNFNGDPVHPPFESARVLSVDSKPLSPTRASPKSVPGEDQRSPGADGSAVIRDPSGSIHLDPIGGPTDVQADEHAHPSDSTNVGESPEAADELVRQHVAMRVLISTKEAGIVIGQSGVNVAEIRHQSGARVTVSDMVSGAHERVLTVAGPLDAVAMAFSMVVTRIAEKIKVHESTSSRKAQNGLTDNAGQEESAIENDEKTGLGCESREEAEDRTPDMNSSTDLTAANEQPGSITYGDSTGTTSGDSTSSSHKKELPVKARPISLRFLIPHVRMGSIIGRHGVKIKEIQELSGSRITASEEMLPNSTERVVTVTGVIDAIHIAAYHLGLVLLEHPERNMGLLYYKPTPGYMHRAALAMVAASASQSSSPGQLKALPDGATDTSDVSSSPTPRLEGEAANSQRSVQQASFPPSPSAGAVQMPFGLYPLHLYASGAIPPGAYGYAPVQSAYLAQPGFPIAPHGNALALPHQVPTVGPIPGTVHHPYAYRPGQAPVGASPYYHNYGQASYAFPNSNPPSSHSPVPQIPFFSSARPQYSFPPLSHSRAGAPSPSQFPAPTGPRGTYYYPQTPPPRHNSMYHPPSRQVHAAPRRSSHAAQHNAGTRPFTPNRSSHSTEYGGKSKSSSPPKPLGETNGIDKPSTSEQATSPSSPNPLSRNAEDQQDSGHPLGSTDDEAEPSPPVTPTQAAAASSPEYSVPVTPRRLSKPSSAPISTFATPSVTPNPTSRSGTPSASRAATPSANSSRAHHSSQLPSAATSLSLPGRSTPTSTTEQSLISLTPIPAAPSGSHESGTNLMTARDSNVIGSSMTQGSTDGSFIKQLVFVPNALVGAIIGKGGSRISEIRQASGCHIKIGDYGSSASIEEVLAEAGTVATNAEDSVSVSGKGQGAATLTVSSSSSNGHAEDGSIDTGANGEENGHGGKNNNVSSSGSGGGRLVTITGPPEAAQVALFMLKQRLEIERKRSAPGSRRW